MDVINDLLEQANGLAIMIEEAEVVAAHFRPRYTALFALMEKAGRRDDPVMQRQLFLLQEYVHKNEAKAKHWRAEELTLRMAADLLKGRVTHGMAPT
jgi:hypothetical protein